jgi:hypothetical protein
VDAMEATERVRVDAPARSARRKGRGARLEGSAHRTSVCARGPEKAE